MRLFTIDPSSTSIGYSLMSDHRTLIEHGRVTPDMAIEPHARRVTSMAVELVEIIAAQRPTHILIEMPADQAPQNGAQGQGKYGVACGIVFAKADDWAGSRWQTSDEATLVECIQSDKWPRRWRRAKSDKGVQSRRQVSLRSQFPSYDPRRDPKQDIADAIELGQFWFGRQMKPSRSQ